MSPPTDSRSVGDGKEGPSPGTLRHVNQLIQAGEYSEALAVIDGILTRSQVNPFEQARWQVLKSLVFTRQGQLGEGLALAEQVVASLEEAFNSRSGAITRINAENEAASVLLEARLAQVEALERLGRHETALNVTKVADEDLERITHLSERSLLEARLRFLQGTVLWRLGKFEEALGALKVAMELVRDLSDATDLRASILHRLGTIYRARGDLAQALEYYQQSLDLREELGNTQHVAESLNAIGNIYYDRGDLTKALEYHQQSLKLREEVGNTQEIASSLNNIGMIYRERGDLAQALEYHQQSLKLFEQIGNTQAIATSLLNIGVIYHDRGDLTKALEYYQQSLKLFEQIGNTQAIATSLNNIGEIYRERGDLITALECLQQSLTLREEMGNPLELAETLLELIMTTLECQDHDRARQYLQQLESITRTQPHSPQISQRYRIGKALLLKSRSRAQYQFEAQRLFQQIAEEEVVDHELTTLAMVNLVELLLLELKTSPSDEVLAEVKHWLGRLLNVAKTARSYSLLAQVYLLHAKFSLLELDLPRARQLFGQAHLMAEEHGLNLLAAKIASEYDAFLDQLSYWEELAERGASVSERIKLVDLEALLRQVLHKRVEDVTVEPETPVMIMVLNETGMQLFTTTFNRGDAKLNEHLIASFLAAMESFSNELFATSDMTGDLRVRKSGYTLLLHRHGSVLFCYVFQGGSYHAVRKLKTLIKTLRQSEELWNALLTYPDLGLPLPPDLRAILEDHVTRIFGSR